MAMIGKRARPKGGIPTSSMADIAFLLLVFFLVTTVFPKDRGLAIVLPEGPPVDVSPNNILHFLISASGVVEVRWGSEENSQHVRPDRIEDIWREAVAQNPRLIAAVKTHPDAPYRHMIDVLDGLHVAGAERISLQILPK